MTKDPQDEFDLLVIGAGSGGVRCARIAAQHGARVAIVEARYFGGTCVNVGCVPKKLFVYAADYARMAAQARSFGWDQKGGAHHWDQLIAAKDAEIARLNDIYVKMLQKAGVTLITGTAAFESAHEVSISPSALDPMPTRRRIRAKRIVIAVGGHPTRPDLEGAELGIVSDDAFYLKARPNRILIVGGGYIGVEFAGIFSQLGSSVDLVSRSAQVLRGFDGDLRAHLTDAMVRHGIRVHGESMPVSVQRRPDGTLTVTLDSGKSVETDCVFFATGRRPRLDGLGLSHAGVRTEGGRIVTNEAFETSVPHIFAIGDVTDRINLTPVAIAEGHMLADRLYGHTTRKWSFETTPKAVFYSQPLASVGLTEDEAAEIGDIDIYMTSFRPMRQSFSADDDKVLIKLVVNVADDRVVGAHMMGDAAPEIMQSIAVAVTAGLKKSDFDQTIGIHPTTAEEVVTMRTATRRRTKS